MSPHSAALFHRSHRTDRSPAAVRCPCARRCANSRRAVAARTHLCNLCSRFEQCNALRALPRSKPSVSPATASHTHPSACVRKPLRLVLLSFLCLQQLRLHQLRLHQLLLLLRQLSPQHYPQATKVLWRMLFALPPLQQTTTTTTAAAKTSRCDPLSACLRAYFVSLISFDAGNGRRRCKLCRRARGERYDCCA